VLIDRQPVRSDGP